MKNSIKFIFALFSVAAFLGAFFLNAAFAQNNVSAGNAAALQIVPEGCLTKKAGGQPDFEFVQKPEYEKVLTKQRIYALDEDRNIISPENPDEKEQLRINVLDIDGTAYDHNGNIINDLNEEEKKLVAKWLEERKRTEDKKMKISDK